MLKVWHELALLVLVFCTVLSCNFNPDGVNPPSWKSSFIGPLANSKITLEDLLDFDSLGFNYEVSASELSNQIPPGGATFPLFPPFSLPSLPPDTFDIAEGFQYAIFDSGEIVFEFINNLPITLNSGQIISVYSVVGPNRNQLGDKIFDFKLEDNLEAGGRATTIYSDFTGLVVSSRLIIQIDTVSSPGSTTPVTFDSESGFELTFFFRNIKVREVGVSAGNSFVLGDTTPFTFSSGTIPSTLESGILKLRLRNGIPLNIDLNLDLYDENMDRLGSFIEAGQNIISASDTSTITVVVDENNLDLLNNTSFLVSSVLLEDQAVQGDTVIINSDSLVRAKIIGEVDVDLVK